MGGSVQERFKDKIIKDEISGCWNWTAGKGLGGYGRFKIDGRTQYAHRISYQMYIGEIPDSLHVLHQCDNPSCVNPSHLFLGTDADNAHDRDNKGRGADQSGEKHGGAKLTEEKIRLIRSKQIEGASSTALAKEFCISRAQILRIVRRERWVKI